jgi:hypothetical protein
VLFKSAYNPFVKNGEWKSGRNSVIRFCEFEVMNPRPDPGNHPGTPLFKLDVLDFIQE